MIQTSTRVVFLLCAAAAAGFAQTPTLTANTKFFTVDKYYALDRNGDYYPYRASGFYEPGAASTKPRVFLLPRISIDTAGIKFFSGGNVVTPSTGRYAPTIESINIPLKYSGSLPSDEEAVGIATQVQGQSQPGWMAGPVTDAQGNPVIPQFISAYPQIVQGIKDRVTAYKKELEPQAANLKLWKSYQSEATGINELKISLVIDGDVIADRFVAGAVAMQGNLPVLAVKNPAPEVIQRVASGNFEVQVNYRFRDANVGSIDASFDVKEIIDDYVRETQKAITTSKSSGMQLFHIGSRRTKVKQSMERSMTHNATVNNYANTVIVMDDATDAQVDRFDATFFPSLSQAQVINGHLAAAAEATSAGKPDLAAAHMEYAKALQNGVALAEVDAVGAAAALNEGDYATFLAKGVRFMDASTNNSGSFVRVASEKITTTAAKTWTDVAKRSVQRSITLVVVPGEKVAHRPRLGICGWGSLNFDQVLVLTCLDAGGPLALSGVQNGETISQVNGQPVGTIAALENALTGLNPGDEVEIVFVDAFGQTKVRKVKLRRGLPRQ